MIGDVGFSGRRHKTSDARRRQAARGLLSALPSPGVARFVARVTRGPDLLWRL